MLEYYEDLKNGIILQAVKDYCGHLKRSKGRGKNAEKHKAQAKALEKWFLSPWGAYLTDGAGALIIAKCKERVSKKQKVNRRQRYGKNITTERADNGRV